MVQQKKFEQTFINEYMAIKLHESDIERRAMEKGRLEGKAEGEVKKATSIAENMLKTGKFSIAEVSSYTGISEDSLKLL